MKVLAVKLNDKNSYRVTFSNGRTVVLSAEIVWDHGISEGAEFDLPQIRDIMRAAVFLRLYNTALNKLSYRDYSASEMLKKLSEDCKNPDLCEAAVQKLISENLINDERYAEKLAYKYVEVRKFGKRRAMREMVSRGISRFTAEDALRQYDDVFEENIMQLLSEKYSRYLADINDKRAIDKVKNSLIRSGYDFSLINCTIKDYFDNMNETLEEQ